MSNADKPETNAPTPERVILNFLREIDATREDVATATAGKESPADDAELARWIKASGRFREAVARAADDRRRKAWALKSMDPSTYGLPSDPTDNVETVRTSIAAVKAAGLNPIGPMPLQISLAPCYRVGFAVVQFDPDPKGPHVYKTDGGLALRKAALDQLVDLCGVRTVRTERLDDRSLEYVVGYEATIKMTSIDGEEREIKRTKWMDLRDGGAEAKAASTGRDGKQTPRRLEELRVHLAAHCETKAHLRAVRAMLGIRTYTQEEIGRPFVAVTLNWIPDMSNPEIARMVAAKQLGIVDQVYGGAAAATAQRRRLKPAPASGAPAPAPAPAQAPEATRPAIAQEGGSGAAGGELLDKSGQRVTSKPFRWEEEGELESGAADEGDPWDDGAQR
jgi:hypothetical protein